MKFNKEFTLSDLLSLGMIALMAYLSLRFVSKEEYVRDRETQGQVLAAQGKMIAILQTQTESLKDHEIRLRDLERHHGVGFFQPNQLDSVESKSQESQIGKLQ